jgi:hypothetical protein
MATVKRRGSVPLSEAALDSSGVIKKSARDGRRAVTVRLRPETLRNLEQLQQDIEAAIGFAPSTQDAIERALVLGIDAVRKQFKRAT